MLVFFIHKMLVLFESQIPLNNAVVVCLAVVLIHHRIKNLNDPLTGLFISLSLSLSLSLSFSLTILRAEGEVTYLLP